MSALSVAMWALGMYSAASVAWFLGCKVVYWLLGGIGFLTKHTFPDGRTFTIIKGDLGTKLIHKEIFAERCYFRHGVTLERCRQQPSRGGKPLVIDVGGNIGLFSAFIAEHAPEAEIHCFEPAPLMVQATAQNVSKFGKVLTMVGEESLRRSQTSAAYNVYQVAIGSAVSAVEFTFDPRTSASSTFVKDAFRQPTRSLIAWTRAVYLDGIAAETVPEFPTRLICTLLGIPVVKYVAFPVFLPLFIWHALLITAGGAPKQKIQAQVVPLSSVIAAQGLRGRPIAMLKIDVEGAEWQVLEGISDEDWSNVEQIVVETHDSGDEGRIEKVKRLLASKGFTSIHAEEEQLHLHALIRLSTVFAVRRVK